MRRANQLSAKLVKKIVEGVQRTTTIELACAIAGVSEAGFYKWQALGRALIAGEVDQDEMTPDELLCVELVESVELARKLSCLPAIDTIQKAIKMGDVKAAEKLLARRMPDAFGDYDRKEVTIKTDSTGEQNSGIANIPTLSSAAGQDLEAILIQQQAAAVDLARSSTQARKPGHD
ncbi:hypothetical protein C4K05_2088 [Pseudomonas chlororaphis subsp. aureofaciens]|jgi:hypothetical protein|uniref:hypothetical protein n=1 Tax=Pseudomonas TaxID=286 RepID=UPI000F57B769|nr:MULTISPECIES: hypothetical protein [Pseudomonas]AZE41438.1 hypothetical protein C4K05_2088 [Pseudomonas chlororaphis subsp. aureofaciens]